jgi:DNA-directed RNA polymerase
VNQSYLDTTSVSLRPFKSSNVRISLAKVLDKFNKRKQVESLMPNLIHSLDAASLTMLIDEFKKNYPDASFYAVHDCYAVTCDKVPDLISILRSVNISFYVDNQYIKKFDKGIINHILDNYSNEIVYNEDKRILYYNNKSMKLYPLD